MSKRSRAFHLRALWFGALALLTSCADQRVDPSSTVQAVTSNDKAIEGPLASLPASLKKSDFRLSPPIIQQVVASPSDDGRRTVVRVDFARDARLDKLNQIVIHPDDQDWVLTRVSNTGFALPVDIDFGTVKAEQQRIRDTARQLGLSTLPVFRHRVKVGEVRIDFDLSKREIQILHHLLGLLQAQKTLAITRTSVVEDPSRTFNPCTGVGTPMGSWTFGRLMTDMSGGLDPAIFVEKWLQTWLSDQVVNGFVVPKRTGMNSILSSWPRLGDGRLNLERAPLKLLAIVNRIDLAGNASYGPVSGAEGRFVFEFVDSGSCSPKRFLVILEYGVPKHSCTEMRDWAHQWLNLETLALGSPAYNDALEAITQQFAGAGADPSKPNGNALNQLRTNEIAIGSPWDLREFHLFPEAGDPALLHHAPIVQTPDRRYNGAQGGALAASLGTFINDNLADVLDDRYTVPLTLPNPPGGPFLAGSTFNNIDFWNAPGIPNTARQIFSKNTCNGCHGRETGTDFVHISTAPFGVEATLSGFMTGITVPDPTGNPPSPVSYHDLDDRAQKLQDFANASCRLRAFPIPEKLRNRIFIDPIPPLVFEPILAAE